MNVSKFRRLGWLSGSLLIAVVGAAVAASPVRAGHPTSSTRSMVKTTSGNILVTPKGRTLYVFAPDPKGKSTCSGECAKFWPPRHVAKGATPAAHISGIAGTFGAIDRADGTRQLTYDGAPVYTFVGDKKAGDMNGQGLIASGGYWWVVVAAGKS